MNKAYIIIALIVFVLPAICIILSKKNQKPKANSPYTGAIVAEEKRQKQAELQHKQELEMEAKKAAQAEWNAKHGRFVTSLSGVTFSNDDGISRQSILRDLNSGGYSYELSFEKYDYNGNPAVHVMADDMCVGNIPKNRVSEFLDIVNQIERGYLEIEAFLPEREEDEADNGSQRKDDEKVYRADLIVIYSK